MNRGGEKLRAWLNKRKMTQSAFTIQLNVSWSTVSNWLRGRRKPNRESALRIEKATGGHVSVRDWED